MSPIKKILSFAQNRDPWQQDFIRRIYTKGELTLEDTDQALQMLKVCYGLLPSEQAPCPECLSESHAAPESPRVPKVTLNSLGEVKYVNRLAENQTLHFAVDGITVIYGDNGSGKSGYCRLLKKLCRVRSGGEEQILGNAFESEETPPAEVTVRFSVGNDSPKEIRWFDGEEPPPELGRFSVFDTRTVPIYADKENKLEFLPHSLDILPKLGALCQSLAGRVDAEIRTLEGQLAIPLPEFTPRTRIAGVVAKLVPATPIKALPTITQLRELAQWDQESEQELNKIERTLKTDAQALALRCRQAKAAVQQLITDLSSARAIIGDDALRKLIANIKTAKTARAAADLAAKTAFQNEPLSGVGTEPWRLMFEYARQYSKIAYPGLSFPVTGTDKVCVLCQQPLAPEASRRLKRFDGFIKDTAEAEAKKLEQSLNKEITTVSRFTLRPRNEIETFLFGIENIDPASKGLKEEIVGFFQALATRHTAFVKSWQELKGFEALPVLPPSPMPKLASAIERLDRLIRRYEQSQNPEQRKILEGQREELLACKKLSENFKTIIIRLRQLTSLSKLKQCKAACDTTAISRKNSELRRLYITQEFEDRLSKEVKEFRLEYLPFRVHERSDRGVSFLGVDLDVVQRLQNKDILSDGEFRALALACFLTEVNTIPHHSGIILDDPVSSLDHVRIRRVAMRLVEEAKKTGQVIIFTHDLVFYYELWMAAAEAQVPLTRHWIRNTHEHGFGTILNKEEPWQAKKVTARLQYLEEKKLPLIRNIQDTTGDEYRRLVMDFYSGLRETWERLVEELLFNGVVTRFQTGVMTQSLKGAQVEDEDYRRVYFAMKRASEFSGHDRTRARQVSFPGHDEIKKDLEDLRSYAKRLKARNKSLEESRIALEKPPEGIIM
jgi:energy-coupling factor transporter ATP-binding protein EcfA2